MSSYLDYRGGLSEMNDVVPFLVAVAATVALAAGRLGVKKSLAIGLAGGAITLGLLAFILAHYIRTSVR